jgi:hypothetical protein
MSAAAAAMSPALPAGLRRFQVGVVDGLDGGVLQGPVYPLGLTDRSSKDSSVRRRRDAPAMASSASVRSKRRDRDGSIGASAVEVRQRHPLAADLGFSP